MGLAPSPQLADLFCYGAEKEFVETTNQPSWLNARYLDDIFAADPIPSEEEYGMKYTTTSQGQDCTYIGVRVYVKEGKLRTTLYDREEDYPIHIPRYPARGTVASMAQWRAVIFGRFVAAQQFCSTMSDFKQSVVWILLRAFERGYSARDLRSTWGRFLQLRWHMREVRFRELRSWFSKALRYAQAEAGHRRGLGQPWLHPRQMPRREFQWLFGEPPGRRWVPQTTDVSGCTEAMAPLSELLAQAEGQQVEPDLSGGQEPSQTAEDDGLPCDEWDVELCEGDGNCLLYALHGKLSQQQVDNIRELWANWLSEHLDSVVAEVMTVREWILQEMEIEDVDLYLWCLRTGAYCGLLWAHARLTGQEVHTYEKEGQRYRPRMMAQPEVASRGVRRVLFEPFRPAGSKKTRRQPEILKV